MNPRLVYLLKNVHQILTLGQHRSNVTTKLKAWGKYASKYIRWANGGPMLVHKTYFSLEFVKFIIRWPNVGAMLYIWCQRLANCPTIFQPYFNVGPTLSCYLGSSKIPAQWIYRSITKTCLYNFYPFKPRFYIVKLGFTGVYIIFLISAHTHRLWIRVPTYYVLSRNMKISEFLS